MIRIHPHALGKIMTEPKTKAAKEAGELSDGAKTYLHQLAKEQIFGYRRQITSKEMEKGIQCEQDSIDLYNSVFFSSHTKNTERRTTDILSGEPDIVDDDLIIDIKTSWSLDTFPITPEQAHDDGYEWQGRAYMMLFDKPRFELAFCMVSTPEDLCKWESPAAHFVDGIRPDYRVTRVMYERDLSIEENIRRKCETAQRYVETLVQSFMKART
jgi:hypothetical protein